MLGRAAGDDSLPFGVAFVLGGPQSARTPTSPALAARVC